MRGCVGGHAIQSYTCVALINTSRGSATAIINARLILHLDFDTLELQTPIELRG